MPVRDCEAPGSNPGPRPFSYSKSAISGVVWSRRVTAGSQFPGELSLPRGAVVTVVGGSEFARQHSMAPRAKGPTTTDLRTPTKARGR